MLETRGTWTDLIEGVGVQFAEVFDQGQEQYIMGIGNVLRTDTMTGAEEHYTGKTGAGKLKKFDDGDDLPATRRYRTYNATAVANNYGAYVDVTKNAIEDRLYDAELDEMKDLSIAANQSQDESGMQIFNGGFATTADVNGYTINWYGDGVPTFSTVHPSTVPGQSTQSNASSTGIPFSGEALETAYVALLKQKTDDGIALSLMGKPMIIVPPDLLKEAQLQTMSELDPDTAENAINVYRNGMKFDMAMSLHLASENGGSATAWFVEVPERAKFYHIVRQQPQLAQDVNIKNKVVTFTVDARWTNVVKDWKRSWGSKGNNVAYSS